MARTPIALADLFRYYRGLPHQMAAIEILAEKIPPSILSRESEWFRVWSQAGRVADDQIQLQQNVEPPLKRLNPSSPFTAKLTPNIRIGEFALDREERRFERQHQVDTAGTLAVFLELVRRQFGGAIVITSGYRPPGINRSVGGASGSEHLYPEPGVGAVDFFVQGADIHQVQAWCDKEWPCSVGYGAVKGFVHLGIRKGRPRLRWDY